MTPYDPSLSDGCSGPVPDLGEAVRLCCLAHDTAYYYGGDVWAFLASNVSLGACVAATEHSLWAIPFTLATTLVGWIWWRRAPRRPDAREPDGR